MVTEQEINVIHTKKRKVTAVTLFVFLAPNATSTDPSDLEFNKDEVLEQI